jgi:effector-binding domain-containing protein
MLTKPRIEYHKEQYYAGIRMAVPVPFDKYLQPAWRGVQRWLLEKGITSGGPAIIRYLTIDMPKKLDIVVGFTIDQAVPGDEHIAVDVLPAGQYATLLYTGPFKGKGIYKATVALMEWANENAIVWNTSTVDGNEWWNGRTEFYLTDPESEPDPKKYQTELAFLIK